MNKPTALLSDFAAADLNQWRQEVERLLKGAPFAKKMFTRTWEGITVNPMYTAADTAEIPWRDSLPGQAPFVRGNHAAGYHAAPWLVAQEHLCPTTENLNLALRDALEKGQSAINLVFDRAGQLCMDADQASADAVGHRGTSINSLTDLAEALSGIDLAKYPLLVQSGGSFLPTAAMVAAYVAEKNGDLTQLSGCLGADPYAGLAKKGLIHSSVNQMHIELAAVTKWAMKKAPKMRTLPIYENPWHDGGADVALSLGLTLSSAVSILRAMEAKGVSPEEAAPHFQFNLAVGTDFFMELAKLRATRLLWSRILEASGVPAEKTHTFIHARTAIRTQTCLDPHVNLLRATTEAMSAVLGGADSLHVSPFDEVDRLPDEFSRRIARNVQLVLAHECHFDQVTDPAGGSWYVESLTRDLAEAAWQKFQAAEAAGGMPRILESGWAQEKVAAAAAKRAEAYAQRRETLVGSNKYPDPVPEERPIVELDCEALLFERTRILAGQRTSATPERHLLVVAQLEKLMDCASDDLFDLVVDAVELGATVGEVTGVTHGEARPGVQVTPIPTRRDGEPFEHLVSRTVALRSANPAGARIYTANLGDYSRYMPRLEFVRGFFQVGGFEISGDEFHTAPQEAVKAAEADGARIVVLVGLDETYAAEAAAVARGLAALPEPPLIVLAGVPGDHEAALREAGVEHFVHMRSNVLSLLDTLLTPMEGQS